MDVHSAGWAGEVGASHQTLSDRSEDGWVGKNSGGGVLRGGEGGTVGTEVQLVSISQLKIYNI